MNPSDDTDRRPQATAPRAARPLLVVLLDGVAYERVHGLYAAGRFRRFRPPARLISVFPTLTDPAYDLLFGTGPTPGYEAGYFDRQANRLTGALRTYLRGGNEAWVRHVDYRLSFLKDAIMYLFPKWVYRSELARARRVLNRRLRAGSRQVVLYILSTDGLAHMLAPAEIDMQLLVLERWIERVAGDWGDELDMVLLSDHGLGRLPPDCTHIQRFDLGAALRAAGLRLVKRLQRPGDVALPLFGLLDVARLHTFDADTRQRAVGVLRGRAEVELVAERDGDRVRVFTAGATAAIRCRCDALGAPRYSYEPEVGDALRLAEACRALRRAGQMDAAGFATGAAWLAATADADFPAAPERLWEAFFSICREQPDTVVSLTERWYVGSGLLSRFVRLQGTHGGLHRRGTETFAMATSLNLPSPLDLRQLAEFLRRELGWPPGPPRG